MISPQGAEEIVETAASSAVTAVKELGPSLAEELMHETMSSESSSGKLVLHLQSYFLLHNLNINGLLIWELCENCNCKNTNQLN